MADDTKLEGIEVKPKVPRPKTRRERVMLRKIDNVRELDVNEIVSFYAANNTLRYYVRLTKPLERRGVCVFHFNKKGRPSLRLIPAYTIPPNTECALVFRRELSHQIDELLFRGDLLAFNVDKALKDAGVRESSDEDDEE